MYIEFSTNFNRLMFVALILVNFSIIQATTFSLDSNDKNSVCFIIKDSLSQDTFYHSFYSIERSTIDNLQKLYSLKVDTLKQLYYKANRLEGHLSDDSYDKIVKNITDRHTKLLEIESLIEKTNLLNQLILHNVYEYDVGKGGEISVQQKRFLLLCERFTNTDYLRMTSSYHSIIQLYGVRGLVNSKYDSLEQVVQGLSGNVSSIEYFMGCINGFEKISILSKKISSFQIITQKRHKKRN